MRRPETIRMFGFDWTVKFNKDESGGSYDWKTKTIELGNKYGEWKSVLLHEIMEAILSELEYRFYGNEKSMEYIFHFDHTGFVRFHKQLFQVLEDNKLI